LDLLQLIYKINIFNFFLGRPAKPKIQNVTILSNGKTFINWSVDHLGNADHVKNVIIEYAPNKIENENNQINSAGKLFYLFDFKNLNKIINNI
jgi:hypothetical protein